MALAVVAASAEGLYAIVDLLRRGAPLAALSDMNVDAVTAWSFSGMRVDNVPRSLWYTPQHTTAVALGLVGWFVAIAGGSAASMRAIAGAGLALGLATTMNPLLGGCFSLVYGAAIAGDAIGSGQFWQRVPKHTIAAVPVVLAVLWGWASKVMDGAGSAVQVGLFNIAAHQPIITLALSLGPILVPALAGLRRVPGAASRPVWIACAGIILGLFLLYFVRISEASWVGFRAGQILLVSIPILLARTFASMGPRMAAIARGGHPRHRPADHHRRYMERAGHRQSSCRTRLSLDAVDHSRPAAGIRLDTREHARDRRRADGADGPRARALDAHPVVCRTADGRRPPDLAPAAARVPASCLSA